MEYPTVTTSSRTLVADRAVVFAKAWRTAT
jgi:hypothetical protein